MTNNWFLVSDAKSGRMLSVVQMHNPENNDTATHAMERIIKQYPNIRISIFDCNCKLIEAAQCRPLLEQIKTWSIDKMHAKRH
eukprot:10057260-Karenia_brevis.AAC.1